MIKRTLFKENKQPEKNNKTSFQAFIAICVLRIAKLVFWVLYIISLPFRIVDKTLLFIAGMSAKMFISLAKVLGGDVAKWAIEETEKETGTKL